MEIRTGKLFLVFILSFLNIFAGEPKVAHRLISPKGVLIKNPIVGEPFLLELTVHDANLITGFDVGNISQFKVRDFRRVTSQSIINGVKTESKNFTYNLIAENPGKFTLGPITVKADDKVVTTEQFDIIVKEKDFDGSFKNSQDPQAKLKMFIDGKNKIFVGQKVSLRVRFYYNSDDITCEAVSQVTSDDFALGSYDGPYEGYENLDNQTFKYLEWTYDIFPKKSGKLIVPALSAAYNLSRSDDMYSLALRMFGAAQERKGVESKPLSFEVFDLPQYKTQDGSENNFDGPIGKFTDLVLSSTGDRFSQSAPIILKLKMVGDGNFETLSWPKLNLPDVIRVTESKKYFEDSVNNMTFEYILQVLEPGTYNIGPQVIKYFDPEVEKFKSLKSNILKFIIDPSEKFAAYEDELDKFLESYDKKPVTITSINNKISWVIIPQKIFLILFLGPLIILLFIILYLIFIFNYQYIKRFLIYKTAFIVAKLKIRLYRKKDRPDKVYDVFDDLFRARLKNYFELNAGQDIENVLNFADQKIKDQEKIKNWRSFYLTVLSYKFSKVQAAMPKDWVFERSIYWLNELEKVI